MADVSRILFSFQSLDLEEEAAVIRPGPAICIVVGCASPSIDICCIPGIIDNRVIVISGIDHRFRVIVGRIVIGICRIPGVGVGRIIPARVIIVPSGIEPVDILAASTAIKCIMSSPAAMIAHAVMIAISSIVSAVITISSMVSTVIIIGGSYCNQNSQSQDRQYQFN